MYRDEKLSCVDCSAPFNFSASEQEFFASKGFTNKPSRCPDCRAARKAQRGEGGGGGRAGGRGGDREMFEPRGDKPVYCRDCFTPRQSYR
jgi:hypothetical protein